MKNIILCLVISFGTLQAFDDDSSSEETLEEFDNILEDLSNTWSSEEESDESKESEQVGLSKNDLPSSEESSQDYYELIKGIGEVFKELLSSNEVSNEDLEVSKFHEKTDNSDTKEKEKKNNPEMTIDDLSESLDFSKLVKKEKMENQKIIVDELSESSQVSKLEETVGDNTGKEKEEEKNQILNDDKLYESRQEPGNVIWTYVLWRPSVLDNSGILQSEINYYQSFNYIKDLLEGRFQNVKEEDEDRQGWMDDREQLDLPRVAALTSDDEPDIYDNLADTFNNMKERIQETVSRPEVKDNIFYILMGLTGFLMLVLFNDNILKKQKPRTIQDHYLLPDTGASAKLPTYDECTKADKNILVNIGDNEVFNKVDLSLPVLAVDTEKDERQK